MDGSEEPLAARAVANSSPRVAVRFLATDAFSDRRVAECAAAGLAPAEREALARLRTAEARRDFLAAHDLTRMTLREFTRDDPRRLAVRFSASHADGMAICAVGERMTLGADVESLRDVGSDALALAELIASRRELQAVQAASPAARSAHLLIIWTLKEALGKATGLGLRFPVRNVTVVGSGGHPLTTPLFDVPPPEEAPHWRLACRYLTRSHLAAVAVRCSATEPLEIEFEEARAPVLTDDR